MRGEALKAVWDIGKSRPRQLWLRRAVFQIHLWLGMGLGLYVFAISVSGSALVFRNELYNAFTATPVILPSSGSRLAPEDLRAAALAAYPGYGLSRVWENEQNPNQAVEIVLERGGSETQRLFDPFTGRDLGNAIPTGIRVVSWLQNLHVNLLGGETGRLINAGAAVLWLVIGVTGALVWWPGTGNWRRSFTVRWKNVGWGRFNWDLHGAAGIWTLAFVLLWGITGLHVTVPRPFWAVVDYLEPPPDGYRPDPRIGEVILRWSARLHFGSFGGRPVQVLWALIGLVPVLLFATGVAMWWLRLVRRKPVTGGSK
jgi:uncharacterized iron-regulated membrane protein